MKGRRRAAADSMASRIFSRTGRPMWRREGGRGRITASRPRWRPFGQHRLADATTGTAEPLRRLSETIGYRQQISEDERIERDEGGVRLAEALRIDQQPQTLAGRDGKVAMATGTDTEGLEGVRSGQLDPA
jgi:hypothetical protein